jgi:hypothetical protein
MTDFLELKRQFEVELSADLKFELLELHYAPYSFGSAMTAYRIKGKLVQIVFDGKDNIIELLISDHDLMYPSSTWTTIYSGIPTDFLDNGLTKLKKSLAI